jgi:hypothetical protein
MSPFLLPSTRENRLLSCAECHLDENSAALLKKALKTNVEAKNPATNFVEVFKATSPQNFILEGQNFLAQGPSFSPDWPKNPVRSLNTGGCFSGGWLTCKLAHFRG